MCKIKYETKECDNGQLSHGINKYVYCTKKRCEIEFKSIHWCLWCNNYNLCFGLVVGQNIRSYDCGDKERIKKIVEQCKKEL